MATDTQPSGEPFLYDAFISYRHVERDRKWAEWLIEALERYRVPKALQDKGLPPRLRKVFRDEDEVPASADLNDQIRQALVASRFLIVVCSAFTPRSKWVEREIEIFNELGRGDQVLALLTEGEPSDSFPSAMLVRKRQIVGPDGTTRTVTEDKEPLAADVRPRKGQSSETLKRLALLRLVAVILGVKFDDLRRRDQERARHGKLVRGAAAAVLALVVGGLGLIYWDMMRPATAYYRQIVWRWGVPEGLGAIDEETRRHLATSYGVTVQRSGITARPRVVEVRRENSAGTLRGVDSLRSDNDGRARWVIRYRDDGSVDRIEGFDANDRLLREDVLRRDGASNRFIVSFERDNIPVARDAHANAIIDPLKPGQRNVLEGRTEITREVLTFDANGFVAERRYQDSWGTAQHDAEGSFGERFTNSPEGLVLHSAEIDADGTEITLKNGVRAVASAYDQRYSLARYTLTGSDGRPIAGPNGFAYYERQSDRWGNDVGTSYFSPDGKPALHADGYAKYAVVWDDRGFQAQLAYFGLDGKPALKKEGYAGFRWKTDDRGRAIEEAYFGVDGNPTAIKDGYATSKIVYDANGHIVEQAFFDVAGNPTLVSYGDAIVRQTFDRRGNLVTKSFFGLDSKPTAIKDGFASFQQAFDDRDNLIETQYFDVNGKPTVTKFGVAKVTDSYDARGNLRRFAVFEVDDKPTLWRNGDFAAVEFAYDERGNQVGTKFFGVDGQPTLMSGGVASVKMVFDDHGNEIERAFFGVDGAPKLNNEGVATYRYRRDARGYIIEGAMFGVDGMPATGVNGNAVWRNVYDERGNRIELSYLGLDGKPIFTTEHIARVRYSYDAQGHEIERAFFGVDGAPALTSTGIAAFRQVFDARGNRVELEYFGLDGKPTLNNEGIAKTSYRYDARSYEIERAFFGVDGKPALGSSGFAKVVWEYDTRGYTTAASYFNVDGKPVAVRNLGYAKVVWAYGARGNLVAESYFGVDGAPASGGGCAKIAYAYDDAGRETKVTCFDAQNRELQFEIAISRVIPGFAGARVGLMAGDRLLTYNGQQVTSIRRLNDLISEAGTGFHILTLRRGSQVMSVSVPSGSLGIDLAAVPVDSAQASATGAQGN